MNDDTYSSRVVTTHELLLSTINKSFFIYLNSNIT